MGTLEVVWQPYTCIAECLQKLKGSAFMCMGALITIDDPSCDICSNHGVPIVYTLCTKCYHKKNDMLAMPTNAAAVVEHIKRVRESLPDIRIRAYHAFARMIVCRQLIHVQYNSICTLCGSASTHVCKTPIDDTKEGRMLCACDECDLRTKLEISSRVRMLCIAGTAIGSMPLMDARSCVYDALIRLLGAEWVDACH